MVKQFINGLPQGWIGHQCIHQVKKPDGLWPPGPTCRISAGLKMFSHFSEKWIKNAANLA
jgi:hypothetical protein